MKFPLWARIAWWTLLLFGTGGFLVYRLSANASSNATPVEFGVLAIFAALAQLGQLIDLVGNIGLGDEALSAKNIL